MNETQIILRDALTRDIDMMMVQIKDLYGMLTDFNTRNDLVRIQMQFAEIASRMNLATNRTVGIAAEFYNTGETHE
jgi:hypothetical protein